MKKSARQPWLDFCATVPAPPNDGEFEDAGNSWNLCSFCRYAEWDEYAVCKHPIAAVAYGPGEHVTVYEHEDCWGFSPNITLAEAAIASDTAWVRYETDRATAQNP